MKKQAVLAFLMAMSMLPTQASSIRTNTFKSQYPFSFWTSGLSAAMILWHPMQNWTEGIPATVDRLALA